MDSTGIAIAAMRVVLMLVFAAQSYLVYKLQEEASVLKNKKCYKVT